MAQAITANMIKELRDRTGVGMGKCKEALEQAHGDIELAITNLRKAGEASAVKKEGRETKEGMIASADGKKAVGLVEVNAETDFVVKNERFQDFLKNLAADIAETQPGSLEAFLQQKYSKEPSFTVDQVRANIVQTIGENIQIKRLKVIPKESQKAVGVYNHLGGKIVTLVEIEGSSAPEVEQLAKDIAMHIAAASPEYLSPEKVPAHIIEQEKDIASSQVKNKPANIVEKILEGKLNAYYDAACLTRQKYIRDDSMTIQDLVGKLAKQLGHELKLTNFLRWNVGQA